jgi:hypothetical protein
VEGCREHGNELSDSTIDRRFCHQPTDSYVLKGPAPCSRLWSLRGSSEELVSEIVCN